MDDKKINIIKSAKSEALLPFVVMAAFLGVRFFLEYSNIHISSGLSVVFAVVGMILLIIYFGKTGEAFKLIGDLAKSNTLANNFRKSVKIVIFTIISLFAMLFYANKIHTYSMDYLGAIFVIYAIFILIGLTSLYFYLKAILELHKLTKVGLFKLHAILTIIITAFKLLVLILPFVSSYLLFKIATIKNYIDIASLVLLLGSYIVGWLQIRDVYVLDENKNSTAI